MLVQAFLNKPLDDKCLDLENQINVIGTWPKKLFGILKYDHIHRDSSQSIILILWASLLLINDECIVKF